MATRLSKLFLLPLLLGFATPATAQNREIEAARRQVAELMEQGRRLEEQGRRDQARELFERADAIRARIRASERRQDAERGDRPDEEAERILHGLELGMDSLRKLRKMDALDILERITADYRRELAERRERRGEHERPARSEADQARHEIEVLQIAKATAAEARDEPASEMLDHAIAARKSALEGRRDADARRLRRTAPNAGALSEILMHCARLCRERGQSDRARVLGELGERYRQRDRGQRRERGESREGEREQRDRERAEERMQRDRERGGEREQRDRERSEGREQTERRMRDLEAQIRELGDAVRRLQQELRKIRR